MAAPASLPEGLTLQRATDELTAATVPTGLLRDHRTGAGVWGLLRISEGLLRFYLIAIR